MPKRRNHPPPGASYHWCPKCAELVPPSGWYWKVDGERGACRECMRAWHRKRAGTVDRFITCQQCGAEKVTLYAKAMYCSRACKDAARQASDAAARVATKAETPRRCPECGVGLDPAMRKDAAFCSEVCMNAAHNTTKKASRRIKARQSDGTLITVKRADIYERDNWTCQLCGEPVERGAKFPAPLAPSLDHIVPLSRGGDHDITNLQTAHLRCNLSRGNTPLSDPAPAVVLEGRRYLTVPEAAAALGVQKWTVDRMVSRGEIASTRFKPRGYRYILVDELDSILGIVAERQMYLTLPEAAEAIGITYWRLDRMVARDEVEVTRFEHSRNRYILADNIDALRGTISGTNLPSSDLPERT